jgi:transposase InsO family protein
VEPVCRLFGKSRQAYYQGEKRTLRQAVDEEVVLVYVRGIRSGQPRLGTRKLYALLAGVMSKSGIRMGRDKFFELLRKHGLLVEPRRKRVRTTDGSHLYRKHPNLIKGYEPSRPEQVWSSDMTYVWTERGFVYVSLITDQYSRKIVGYHVHETLETEGPLRALRMALKHRDRRETMLIHHSDRGIQYCSETYVGLLRRNGIQISMSAPGNPYENAVAERVNGILKSEYYLDGCFRTIKEVRRAVEEAVRLYNTGRPHASCDYLTPEEAHRRHGPLKKRWRVYPAKAQPTPISEEIQQALRQLLVKRQITS